jgi:hypothetical protein
MPLTLQTLSMLPTRILRLLEFVGFSGNKVNAHLWVGAGLNKGGLGDHGLVPILAQIHLCVWPWSYSRPLGLRLPSGFGRPQISPCLASRVDMRIAP